MNKKRSAVFIFWICGAVSILLIAAYALIAHFVPFNNTFNPAAGSTWNDLWLNLITVIAAFLSAVAATAVARSFQKSEPALKIWWFFSFGLWCWFLSEVIWMVYVLESGDVPSPSIADLSWVVGYVAFSVAFLHQHRILYKPAFWKRTLLVGGIWLLVLVFTLLITWMTANFDIRSIKMGGLVEIFYPVADLVIALIALFFISTFGRGAMMRPWLGLLIFALADGIYAWLINTGLYTYTAWGGNAVSIIADTIYMAAYLVLTMGLLAYLLLIGYGPAAFQNRSSQAKIK